MTDTGWADLARAAALVELGRHADAKALLETTGARGAAPTARGWCLMAQCDLGLNHDAGALWDTEQALRMDPEEEWAHRLRAIALTRLQRFAEAQLSAAESIRLAPWNYQGHASLANVFASWPHRAKAALEPARRAVELGPHEAEAHFTYGLALASAGQQRAAKRAYQRALELNPDHVNARNNLGVLALRGGRPGIASEHFVSTLRRDPRSKLGSRNLTIAYGALIRRLSLIARVTLFVVLCGLTSRSTHPGDPAAGRAIVPIFGIAVTFLALLHAGIRTRSQLWPVWSLPVTRWQLLPPSSTWVAIITVAVTPVGGFGWPFCALVWVAGTHLLARTKVRQLRQREGWRP